MYSPFFQLQSNPFSQAHPEKSVFLPTSHRLVLELLSKEVNNSKGVFALIGSIGVGKSSLIKALIEKYKNQETEIFFKHLNPSSSLQLSASEPNHMALIMKTFSDSCSLDTTSPHNKSVFILDNANNFNSQFLNNILEKVSQRNSTNQPTLLILTGQEKLQKQIKNLTAETHSPALFIKQFLLKPFEKDETIDYINHRLSCAEYSKGTLFDSGAVQSIVNLSKGIPWVINTLCSVSLFQASLDKQGIITKETVSVATEFCFLENTAQNLPPINSAHSQLTADSKIKTSELNKTDITIRQYPKNIISTAA